MTKHPDIGWNDMKTAPVLTCGPDDENRDDCVWILVYFEIERSTGDIENGLKPVIREYAAVTSSWTTRQTKPYAGLAGLLGGMFDPPILMANPDTSEPDVQELGWFDHDGAEIENPLGWKPI
jgi:hypothetical protein